jgi:flagellar biosynthesis protein
MTSMRRTAIALEYADPGVPRVTAKGVGPVAERIIETARAAGVAVEENPALAEALSHVELDDEIPEALYRAVAQVILFVLRSTGKLGPATQAPNGERSSGPLTAR